MTTPDTRTTAQHVDAFKRTATTAHARAVREYIEGLEAERDELLADAVSSAPGRPSYTPDEQAAALLEMGATMIDATTVMAIRAERDAAVASYEGRTREAQGLIRRVEELLHEQQALERERDAAVAEAAAMREEAVAIYPAWQEAKSLESMRGPVKDLRNALATPGPGQAFLARLKAAESDLAYCREGNDNYKLEVERLRAELNHESFVSDKRAQERDRAEAEVERLKAALETECLQRLAADERANTARATIAEACGLLREAAAELRTDSDAEHDLANRLEGFAHSHDKDGT